MAMIVIDIHEAKAKLSEYVEAAAAGERVIICNRNRPVAELVAIPRVRATPRPVGGTRGVVVPSSFFDPLPDDVLAGFGGGSDPAAREVSRKRSARRTSRPVRRRARARR